MQVMILRPLSIVKVSSLKTTAGRTQSPPSILVLHLHHKRMTGIVPLMPVMLPRPFSIVKLSSLKTPLERIRSTQSKPHQSKPDVRIFQSHPPTPIPRRRTQLREDVMFPERHPLPILPVPNI